MPVTIKALIDLKGAKAVAAACGINERQVKNWPKCGIKPKYHEALSELLDLPEKVIREALTETQMMHLASFTDTSKEIVREWNRGPESDLIEMISREMKNVLEIGIAIGRMEAKQ